MKVKENKTEKEGMGCEMRGKTKQGKEEWQEMKEKGDNCA